MRIFVSWDREGADFWKLSFYQKSLKNEHKLFSVQNSNLGYQNDAVFLTNREHFGNRGGNAAPIWELCREEKNPTIT